MTPRTPFVSLEEVMQTTGLTKRQARLDVKHGYLPGEFDHRGSMRIRRHEWDAYLAGEWTPADKTAGTPRPVGITSIQRKAS